MSTSSGVCSFLLVPHEVDEDDSTDDVKLEDWMAVETIVDRYRVGGEEYMQESMLGLTE